MKKFEGVTSDGEMQPNPLSTDEYLTQAKRRYNIDERTGQVEEIGGTKHDSGKPDLSLLPQILITETAKAYMYGEKKYGRYNYEGGFESHRLLGACLRHVFAWNEGEERDPESGVSHLAHAAATIGMLLRCQQLGSLTDTRTKRRVRS